MWIAVTVLVVAIGAISLRAGRHRGATVTDRHREPGVIGSTARSTWARAGTQSGSLALLGIGLLAGAASLVSVAWYLSDDLHCPAEGEESNYGESEWSWFPLGTTCRWTESTNGFDRVDDPGVLPTIAIAVMVGVGLAVLLTSVLMVKGRRGVPVDDRVRGDVENTASG